MNSENSVFTGLNPKQKEAVEVLNGPLLILAGAGSGKTKCLTHRIANLIANGVRGDQILAVTFTNKAANEMKTRIEKILQVRIQETKSLNFGGFPTIGTFHSVCVRILRESIEKLDCGISSNFVIFDTSDMQSLMKLIIKEQGLDEKETKPKPLLSHISSAKNQLITPLQYEMDTEETRFTRMVKKLYPLYQKKLQEHNALDFDDLLQKTVELFEQCPEVLEKYRNRWQHLLVDEYQDTNFAQYRIVRLLSDKHHNLCVIGDDHQSIYSFRGADYTNILNFEKDFPNARIIKLEQNYRSTSNILKNANSLISYNETGREKNLWTENEKGDPVVITEVGNEKDEGNSIAQAILSMRAEENIRYEDCAILYRMNAQSRALEEAFMRHQIPYQIIGGTRFFDRMEIKDIIAYLRLIFNPRDDVAFLRIINVPTRKIGPATLDTLKQYAENYTMSYFEILEHIDEIDKIPETKKDVLKNFQKVILDLQKMQSCNPKIPSNSPFAKEGENNSGEPISILLDRLIEKIEYQKYLDDGTNEGEARIQNMKELFSVATRYDSADDSLASFLEGVALISDIDNYQKDSDVVTMMTIHAAKGLEFPVVFLPGWEDGIFPSSSSQLSNEQSEEERRLGYVAITRAEKKCFISHAQSRMLFGKMNYSAPSKFLSELDESCVRRNQISRATSSFSTRRRYDHALEKAKEQVLDFIPVNSKEAIFGIQENKTEFLIGSRVRHADFGEGTVILISGDVLSVAFPRQGIKKLVASVAPIDLVE